MLQLAALCKQRCGNLAWWRKSESGRMPQQPAHSPQEVEAEESKLVEMKCLQPQPMINREELEVMGVRGQCVPSDV